MKNRGTRAFKLTPCQETVKIILAFTHHIKACACLCGSALDSSQKNMYLTVFHGCQPCYALSALLPHPKAD